MNDSQVEGKDQDKPRRDKNRRVLLAMGILIIVCIATIANFKSIRRMIFGDIVFETCIWGGSIQGWLDENENGLWDEGEVAITNQPYLIELDYGHKLEVTSNSTGEASFVYRIVCDTEQIVFIHPLLPHGTELTANPSMYETSTGEFSGEPPIFGFAYVEK